MLCEMLITAPVVHVIGGTLVCTRARHKPFQEQTGLSASPTEEALLHAVACMPSRSFKLIETRLNMPKKWKAPLNRVMHYGMEQIALIVWSTYTH